MPPILGTLVKAAQGKPLFDQQQPAAQQSPLPQSAPRLNPYTLPGSGVFGQVLPQPQQTESAQGIAEHEISVNRNDYRTFPVVRVLHTSTRLINGQMEVRCRIINESLSPVDVHKAELLGTHTELRYPLAPRQDKEFLLYRGPCMQNNAYRDMAIEYKTETGMYLSAIHDIKYHINADRSFSVSEIDLRQPIRHIAG